MTAPPAAGARGAHLRGGHLDDAALVRALDGEAVAGDGDAAASAAAAAHLAGCAACAARVERLRARRARLSALLAATDAPVPAMRPVVLRSAPARAPAARPAFRPAARLAAAGILVAAAGLAAQPVRRWVAAHWADAHWAAAHGRPRAAPARLTVPAAARGAGLDTAGGGGTASVVVSFTPAPGPFTLRFDARPAGGTLTVDVGAGARVVATASPGPGGRAGDFVVLPAALRVRNAAAPRGDYRVTLPAGTARLRVSFDAPAGDTVLSLAGATSVALPLRAP